MKQNQTQRRDHSEGASERKSRGGRALKFPPPMIAHAFHCDCPESRSCETLFPRMAPARQWRRRSNWRRSRQVVIIERTEVSLTLRRRAGAVAQEDLREW